MAKDKPPPQKKNKAAVSLGKRGAKARMEKMTAEQRSAVAKIAIAARWGKRKGDKGDSGKAPSSKE